MEDFDIDIGDILLLEKRRKLLLQCLEVEKHESDQESNGEHEEITE